MGLGPRQPEPVPAPLRFHSATIAPPQPCAGQGEEAGSKRSLLHLHTLLGVSFQEGFAPKAPVATLKSLGRGKALAKSEVFWCCSVSWLSSPWDAEGVLSPAPCPAPRSASRSGTAGFCSSKEEVFCPESSFACHDLGAACPACKNLLEMQR